MRKLSAKVLLPLLLLPVACSGDTGETPGDTATADVDTDTGSVSDTSDVGDDDSSPSDDTDTQDGTDSATPDTDPLEDTSDDVLSCTPDDLGDLSSTAPMPVEGTTITIDGNTCGGDDWFELSLSPDDVLLIAVASEADVAAYVVSERFVELGRTERGEDGVARARIPITDAGTYRVRVYGQDDVVADYALALELSQEFAGCDDDPGEPNDIAEDAMVIDVDARLETRLCPDDVDWYRVEVPDRTMLSAELSFSHEVGDLDMDLWLSAAEEPYTRSQTEGDTEVVYFGPDRPQPVWIRVYGYRGATGAYTLELQTHDGDPVTITATGTVGYEDRVFGAESFTGEIVERTSADVEVEIVRERDGAVVATTQTDSGGAFEVEVDAHAGFAYFARVLSRVHPVGQEAAVRDRSDDERLYGLESARIVAEAGEHPHWDLIADVDDPMGGALNILDVSRDAFQFIAEHTDEIIEPLTYSWQQGEPFSCGSCYSGARIRLGAGVEDTDEYDDDIILHEFGHYFVDYLSRDDSPGGSHNGDPTDPLLAFGEGLATFFSSMVQDDPEYVDNYQTSHRLRDLEAAAEFPEDYYGTVGGTLDGDVSEYLVSAVLWDYFDGVSESEPHDQLAAGAEGSMAVLLDFLPTDRANIGIRGTDLADWMNGVACLDDASVAPLEAVAAEREFPWTEADVVCRKDARPARIDERDERLVLVWDAEVSLAVGDPLTGGSAHGATVPVTLTDVTTGSTTLLACEAGYCELGSASPDRHVLVHLPHEDVGVSWIGEDAAEAYVGGTVVPHPTEGSVRVYRTDLR